MNEATDPASTPQGISRRDVILQLFALAATATISGCRADNEALRAFFQERFQEMSPEQVREALARLEKQYTSQFGKDVHVANTPAQAGVLFGYALDIARCIGCRRCVYACVNENNQSRDPQVHWITVLQMDKEKGIDLEHSTAQYNPETVPAPGHFYFPVACQQCETPPCVKTCPVKATWKEPDGIVVIDYNWCIGCRCCVTACPYGARHFNWAEPKLPAAELNPDQHYLGNRPRPKGVVEKCTFCIQRTRKGRYPACVEICPVGARKFGNLLDPESEIRQVMDTKRVFIFKEELATHPHFYYFYAT